MQVSFIVPLYNCLSLTQAMLASLRDTLPGAFDGEIIFVDDGSTDGTRKWLGNICHSSITQSNSSAASVVTCRFILNEKNSGFAASCNRGAIAAKGNILFFLNSDLVLLPQWLEPMLAAFDRFPHSSLIGNMQLNAATNAVDHAGIFFNHKGKPEHDSSRPLSAWMSGYRQVPALTGACFAIRRATWEHLGGFDEKFINGAEDVDLCLRANSIGLRNYVALRSVVRHHISASFGRKLRDEQNTYRLVQRWNSVIARLSARDWCGHFITTHWDQSFVYDDVLGREALYYWLGLSSTPSARVLAGITDAINLELRRWEKLLSNPP